MATEEGAMIMTGAAQNGSAAANWSVGAVWKKKDAAAWNGNAGAAAKPPADITAAGTIKPEKFVNKQQGHPEMDGLFVWPGTGGNPEILFRVSFHCR